MQTDNDDEVSIINSNELNISGRDSPYASNHYDHLSVDELNDNFVNIDLSKNKENLLNNKSENSQSTQSPKISFEDKISLKKSCCQKNCSHRAARVFYWLGMILIAASIIGIYFSVVNLYNPLIQHYRQGECQVNHCVSSDILLTCCSGSGITRQCTTKLYTSLNFTFNYNETNSYTKKEVYDCDGPIGHNSWEYYGMCDDPLLHTIKCYYDDRDIYNSLHLTHAYQYPMEVITSIIVICIFVFMIVLWSIYSFVYCSCFRQFH